MLRRFYASRPLLAIHDGGGTMAAISKVSRETGSELDMGSGGREHD